MPINMNIPGIKHHHYEAVEAASGHVLAELSELDETSMDIWYFWRSYSKNTEIQFNHQRKKKNILKRQLNLKMHNSIF